ncbi:glycogen phosphorylase [Escherichia coli]|uniref:Alpha-1,4 glucan phosphorylase n=1 Tax=Escherichia coli TaxID=562 RepID=A0A2X1JDT6_ECOLX|nr:glycogen phosphorylase [Escherichia coli]
MICWGKILPRHLQIIFEINDYFLKTLQEQYPNDTDLLGRASIIDESNGRRVRMAWLAVVVSHKVNGVSELHSNLMVQSLFCRLCENLPGSFHQRHQRCDAASLASGSEPIAFSRAGRTPGP